MKLHQIYIVDGAGRPEALPEDIRLNIASFRQAYPGSDHKLWSQGDLAAFVKVHFGERVLRAFARLKPYAYKADLARLCVLFIEGGIYSDLGMRFVAPLSPPAHVGLAAFRSLMFLTSSWTTVSNGIIFSKPQRPELARAIQRIVDHTENEVYGDSPLFPTGPILWGHAVAKTASDEFFGGQAPSQWIGQVVPDAASGCTHHIDPNRLLVAMNMKRGRGLGAMGVSGANLYSQAWEAGDIYNA